MWKRHRDGQKYHIMTLLVNQQFNYCSLYQWLIGPIFSDRQSVLVSCIVSWIIFICIISENHHVEKAVLPSASSAWQQLQAVSASRRHRLWSSQERILQAVTVISSVQWIKVICRYCASSDLLLNSRLSPSRLSPEKGFTTSLLFTATWFADDAAFNVDQCWEKFQFVFAWEAKMRIYNNCTCFTG